MIYPEPPDKNVVKTSFQFLYISPVNPQLRIFNAIVNNYLELDSFNKKFETALNCFNKEKFLKNLVGFTSNRASVSRGEKQSFKRLLRDQSPRLVFIWCVPHCLK